MNRNRFKPLDAATRMNLPTVALIVTACFSAAPEVLAQEGADYRNRLEEVIVTARKRDESMLDVPVTQTVLTGAHMERQQVVEFSDLPSHVPGLLVGSTILTNGATLAVRGVGTTTQDQGVESTVALNIDGMPITSGLAYESGLFDIAQVEVLKGPQALFFGKNSPGGLIALRTADPKDYFELIGRFGYEDSARTYRTEMIVSGPVTSTLGLRLAAMYLESDGYFKSDRAEADLLTGAQLPRNKREPEKESYVIRGTALWSPTDKFEARVKVNMVHDHMTGSVFQYANCPSGTAPVAGMPDFIGPAEADCKLDDRINVVSLNPDAFPGVMNSGHPFTETDQLFTSMELGYHLTDELTFTSLTGWYELESRASTNPAQSTYAAPPLLADNPDFLRKDFTQEFRLDSSFSSPWNFSLGLFYQDGELTPRVRITANRFLLPEPFWNAVDLDIRNKIDIETLSAFSQVRWAFSPKWELAVGARYTDEQRRQNPLHVHSNELKPVLKSKISDNNVSPEATLTYWFKDDVTFFAAYKEGFKSGSFSTSTPTEAILDNAFGPEEVKGGELGVKSRLFDRQLNLNASVYYYEYDGLQVGATEPRAGTVGVKTLNAGGAEIYGIEMDAAYAPHSLPSLTMNMAVNWNEASYTSLPNVPCWGGQLISEGCNQVLDPSTGLFTAQDLSDTQLVRAPEWQGNIGFTYDFNLSNGYQLVLSNNNSYTSSYPTLLGINRPGNDNYQDAYWKVDLGLTLKSPSERFEVSLLAKNVTNEHTTSFCTTHPVKTGMGVFPGSIKGGTSRGAAGIDPILCNVDPGRELWLKFSYRFRG